jgi:hypothetical protein
MLVKVIEEYGVEFSNKVKSVLDFNRVFIYKFSALCKHSSFNKFNSSGCLMRVKVHQIIDNISVGVFKIYE